MPKPPINPDSFDKVNFVIEAWTTGCNAPWYIYIETLKPAALEAFIVLISFGWADVIRGRLRPKGLGRRTSKRKGRFIRRFPVFPEIGNTLGKAIPFGEQLEDFVKWGSATKFLWRIDNAMQAALFMWLVADVAEDFVFNWTSLLYESYWCQEPAKGRFSSSKNFMQSRNGGIWILEFFPDEDFETSPPHWGVSSGGTGSVSAVITAALKFEPSPTFDPPSNVAIRIWDQDKNEDIYNSGPVETDSDGKASVPVSGVVPPGVRFQVWSWHDAIFAEVGDGVVIGHEV